MGAPDAGNSGGADLQAGAQGAGILQQTVDANAEKTRLALTA